MSSETDHDPAAVVADLGQPVLLFDGVCNLCNGFVRFVVRFDGAGTFRFAELQSDVGQELLDQCGMDPDPESYDTVVLVDEDGFHTKSTAALRVLRRLDGPLPLLYALSVVPERIRDAVYDLVAEYRYELFGRTESCPVPEPGVRERFVERKLDAQ